MENTDFLFQAQLNFDEFIAFAKTTAKSPYWHVRFFGQSLTHENDQCYLMCDEGGEYRFEPGDMLIADSVKGVYIEKQQSSNE